MSNDLFDRIVSERGSFANLMTRIPLLGDNIESYLDMDAARDADRIIRDHVAGQLRAQITRLAQVEGTILDNGGLAYMSKTRSSKTRLQTLTDRITTAASGYAVSGALKVEQDDLAKVYAFDEAMLRYIDQVTGAVDALQAAANNNEGINEALAGLDSVVAEASSAFDLRGNLLSGLS